MTERQRITIPLACGHELEIPNGAVVTRPVDAMPIECGKLTLENPDGTVVAVLAPGETVSLEREGKVWRVALIEPRG